MNRRELKQAVLEANLDLHAMGLAPHTWGNVSGIDRGTGEIAIKPSGVEYHVMTQEDIVVVDIDGRVIEGKLRPSSDLATHLALYRAFSAAGGVAHTHSPHATAFAQARREIPCLGTTHADAFYGAVPVTREMRPDEIKEAYEANTGNVIAERFEKLDPAQIPGVLVAGHGPFTWGADAAGAAYNASVLEEVARMALYTQMLTPGLATPQPISQVLLDKHFLRKHGSGAYYGQV